MASERIANMAVDRCTGCASLWFDASELDAELERRGAERASEDGVPDYGMSGRTCPRCYPHYLRLAGWHDLRFDRCPQCHGFLVEPGELDALCVRPPEQRDLTPDVASFAVMLGHRLLVANGYAWLIIRVVQALRR